jgi:hypothetical protein
LGFYRVGKEEERGRKGEGEIEVKRRLTSADKGEREN